MSETASFGNLVNALNSVRNDYNEHLKSVPQYEAFLLVESSTRKVFETLHGFVNAPAPSMAAEVISSLELAKTKFRQHLTSVPEYRALLAIDKLINDVSIDLGIVAAPAPTALATAEVETPPQETTSIPSGPAVAATVSEPAVAQAEITEVISAPPTAATLPEPELAGNAPEPATMQPEATEITWASRIVAAQPESEPAVSTSEHQTAPPEAADIAPAPQVFADQTEPTAAASEPPVTQPEPAEIAVASPPTAAQDEQAGSASPDHVAAAPTTEPPPTSFVEGSEKAA